MPGAGSGYLRLTPAEEAIGWPLGRTRPVYPTGAAPAGARTALERVIRHALEAGRTFVTFSGGRDSSAVLAVAAYVARRDGLPLPVPISVTYPDLPGADESPWQQLVLEHLGLTERVVLTVRDEQRWLGPAALDSLHRRGPLWPPAIHIEDRVFAQVAGGQLLTGEGGDGVLGSRRITPLHLLLRARRPPRPVLLRAAAEAVLPGWVRARAAALRGHPVSPWVRGEAARALVRADTAAASMPWRWDAATRSLAGARSWAFLVANYGRAAGDHGVTVHHPFLEPSVVDALATEGGTWGFNGRTHLMRVLFSDLLPDELLARRTKGVFNGARFGAGERAFARRWDGSGVDPSLVDVAALREHWLGDRPSSATAVLLHRAWLSLEDARPHPHSPRGETTLGTISPGHPPVDC